MYFFTKNFKKNKNKNKKLNSIKVEAFFIKKIKIFKSYKLNLSKNVKIHLIFNIFLLKLIDSNTFIQKIFRYNTWKKKFKVKIILKQENQKYLVK